MTISSSGLTPSPSADGVQEVGAPRSSMSTEYLSAPLLSVWVWTCTVRPRYAPWDLRTWIRLCSSLKLSLSLTLQVAEKDLLLCPLLCPICSSRPYSIQSSSGGRRIIVRYGVRYVSVLSLQAKTDPLTRTVYLLYYYIYHWGKQGRSVLALRVLRISYHITQCHYHIHVHVL